MMGKIEMWLDAKKSFMQMDEDCNMNNEIGVQVVDLDTIVVKKTMKKIKGEKSKTSFKEVLENDYLVTMLIRSWI